MTSHFVPWELKHKNMNMYLINTPDEVSECGCNEGKLTVAFRWVFKSREPIKAEIKEIQSYDLEDDFDLIFEGRPEELKVEHDDRPVGGLGAIKGASL
jgi:hypothetical protein